MRRVGPGVKDPSVLEPKPDPEHIEERVMRLALSLGERYDFDSPSVDSLLAKEIAKKNLRVVAYGGVGADPDGNPVGDKPASRLLLDKSAGTFIVPVWSEHLGVWRMIHRNLDLEEALTPFNAAGPSRRGWPPATAVGLFTSLREGYVWGEEPTLQEGLL